MELLLEQQKEIWGQEILFMKVKGNILKDKMQRYKGTNENR